MIKPGRILLSSLVLGVGTTLAMMGCGGGGTYQQGEYHDAVATYRIGDLDGSWSRIDVDDDNDLAFRNEGLGAIIQVNATCDPSADAPLAALRNHLLIGFTEREVASEDLVPLDGREALRTHVVAKLDGVAREMWLTVLKKDGCVYDFALVTPPGSSFGRATVSYDAALAGFATQTAATTSQAGGESRP